MRRSHVLSVLVLPVAEGKLSGRTVLHGIVRPNFAVQHKRKS